MPRAASSPTTVVHRVQKSRRGGHEVLDAIANATVILAPRHLTSVGAEVGAADPMMDAHLGRGADERNAIFTAQISELHPKAAG